MEKSEAKTEKPPVWIGLLCAGIGLYFMLIGLGVLPVPGGPRNIHGPIWMGFAAGLAFFLGGVTILVQIAGGANQQGELPANAPFWMKAAQHVSVIVIALSFAAMATPIAFGPGDRKFGGSIPLVGSTGEMIGRTAFGIGAVITWLIVFAFANRARKQLFGGGKDEAGRA